MTVGFDGRAIFVLLEMDAKVEAYALKIVGGGVDSWMGFE